MSNNKALPQAIHRHKYILAITIALAVLAYLISTSGKAFVVSEADTPFIPKLIHINVDSIDKLEMLYQQENYTWPVTDSVPAISLKTLPDGLSQLEPEQKKSIFFRIMMPLVASENLRISYQREFLESAFNKDTITDSEQQIIRKIAREYSVEWTPGDQESTAQLFNRVDIIPASLVIAQAANESGWGTSRFAIEGQALFGEWTYNSDSGLKPLDAASDSKHHVKTFPRLIDSVKSYMNNINTFSAYKQLRELRRDIRENGKTPTGYELASGLENYSERGKAYVKEIRNMIKYNGLASLKNIGLHRANEL